MHPDTKRDLKLIEEKENKMDQLAKEITAIRDNCKHLDDFIECRESLQYTYTPMKLCVVCDEELARGDQLTVKERYEALENALGFYEDETGPKFSHVELLKMAEQGGFEPNW